MSKKETKKQGLLSEPVKQALLYGGLSALLGVGLPLYGTFGSSWITFTGIMAGSVVAAVLYSGILEKERRKGRKESKSLIKTLQREKDRQLRREKIRTARKMNDKLALKAAILEEASASKREKREDTVSDALSKGTPLSAKEALKLHAAEDIKRRNVARRLIRDNRRTEHS